jgi:predicted nucleic acid-binding protein
MSVLVDTSIWSLAFRRKTVASPEVAKLSELIQQNKARIIGAIRQEILSGIRDPARFEIIREQLTMYPDLSLSRVHYERAAEFNNLCRAKGIQGSPADFLICAVADLNQVEVFTTDRDFEHFSKLLPVKLFPSLRN